jgi:hypothetical protein
MFELERVYSSDCCLSGEWFSLVMQNMSVLFIIIAVDKDGAFWVGYFGSQHSEPIMVLFTICPFVLKSQCTGC